MTQALPKTLPATFFDGLDSVAPQPGPGRSPATTVTADLYKNNRPNSFNPSKAMMWHDSIIDDLIANPGTTIKATAGRLGRSPVTIGYIINSDLFKARYAQRRDQFNEELDTRLIGKLAKVAELSLDLTLESLEKKRTAVPLPLLHEVSDKALARLGYGPKQGAAAAVAVTVNNTSAAQVVAPVSSEALAAARNTLKAVEDGRAATARNVTPSGDGGTVLESSARESAAGGGEEGGSRGGIGAP